MAELLGWKAWQAIQKLLGLEMIEDSIILTRRCLVESPHSEKIEMLIRVHAPENRVNHCRIKATISCGKFSEELTSPGDDDFSALTFLLERIADRLQHIATESGIDIYWQKKGDLESGAFWGAPLAPWEIAVRSKLSREFVAAHPDLPKILTPSARIAIDEETGGVQIFRVQPDGSDSLGFTVAPEDGAKMEPDELALLIGRRVLWSSDYGRKLYGQKD